MQNGNKKPNYKCKIKTDVQFCWDLFFFFTVVLLLVFIFLNTNSICNEF